MLNIKTKPVCMLFFLILATFMFILPPLAKADHLGRTFCEANFEPGPGLDDCLNGDHSSTGTGSTGGVDVECVDPNDPECFPSAIAPIEGENPINTNLNRLINFASVGLGIVITISVGVAGIQWATSGGDPQKRSKAISRIWNSAIALFIFIFGWAILNWLIPGGPLG